MNNERRRIHELKILSAYLDNELDPADREQLEKRLGREPELREKLENLRRTKITLGSLARLKAPRNFTLTPEMVPVRRKKQKPLFTFMRWASSFAAILLILLVGVQLVLGGGFKAGSQLAAEAPVNEADTFTAKGTPEPLILWGDSESGGAGAETGMNGYGSGGGIEIERVEQPETADEAAPMEEFAEETSTETEVSKRGSEQEEDIILGLKPEEGGEILTQSEPAPQDSEINTAHWGAIRWIEIALAVIALGGGIIIWLSHRS
jgi:hypothetical protein